LRHSVTGANNQFCDGESYIPEPTTMLIVTSFDPHFLLWNRDQPVAISAKFENILSKRFSANLDSKKKMKVTMTPLKEYFSVFQKVVAFKICILAHNEQRT